MSDYLEEDDILTPEQRKEAARQMSKALAVAAGPSLSLYDIEDALVLLMEEHQATTELLALWGGRPDMQQEVQDAKASLERIEQEIREYCQQELKKVDSTVGWLKQQDSMVEQIKAEQRRLKLVRQYVENRIEFVERAILAAMNRSDTKKIEGRGGTWIRRQNSPKSVEITDAIKVPVEYLNLTKVPDLPYHLFQWMFDKLPEGDKRDDIGKWVQRCQLEPSPSRIKAALERGEDVPGAKLVQDEHLRHS